MKPRTAQDAQFLTPLRVEVLTDGSKLLLADLVFYSAELRGTVTAPAGFISDFASTPRISWSIFPKDGKYTAAAVLHDGAYRASLMAQHGQRMVLIKPLADRLFLEAMTALGVSWVARTTMFRLVRAFGGRPYGGLGHPVIDDDDPPRAA